MLRILHRKLVSLIREYKLRYLPYRKLPFVWIKNRKLRYKAISIDEAKNYAKSDTVFVLGSGPSIKTLTNQQWQHISENDSFGINYSFLLGFAPTFFSMEDGKIKWVKLAASCGARVLDDAALETVRRAAPLPFYPKPITVVVKYSLIQ